MRGLTDWELIGVWEAGRGRPAGHRAALPLAAIGVPPGEVADWPVGRRSAWLLAVRAWTLGPTLDAVGRCPAAGCRQPVELAVAVADLLAAVPDDLPAEAEVEAAGWALTVRPPTARDLTRAAAERLPPEEVLRGCVVAARRLTPDAPDDPFPAATVAAERAAERLDPLAVVELVMACPACGTGWAEPLDVVEFVWAEFAATARRLVREVHELASAYGWTEGEILALSRTRRRMYRDLIGTRPSARRAPR